MPRKQPMPELLNRIQAMEKDDALEEVLAMSDDEVAKSLEADGIDARAVGERGAALAKALIERRERLQWQVEAREKLEKARATIATIPKGPRLSRAEMIARIEEARSDPDFALALAARKGGVEEASDEDLESLLEELAMQRALRDRRDE